MHVSGVAGAGGPAPEMASSHTHVEETILMFSSHLYMASHLPGPLHMAWAFYSMEGSG